MKLLPTELADYTIDFLHSDRETLSVCSLVCRNWLPVSRFHLFGTTGVYYSNVESFVKLLASPLSFIAGYVHTLHVQLDDSNLRVFDTIAPYLKDFVAVKSFSMTGWERFRASEENLSRGFGRIGNMELTGITYDISHFSFEFTLGNGPPKFLSRLRFLCSVKSLMWQPTVAQFPAVRVINLFRIQGFHLPIIQAILRSAGQSIHTINIDFLPMWCEIASISDCVDLTHNTNLRSLSLNNLDLCGPEEVAIHRSFPKIFKRISSFSLTHIRIDIWVDDYMNLTLLGCKEVADELIRPRFSKLQSVHVDIHGAFDKKGDAMAWVRDEMSCLEDRGILTVDFRGCRHLEQSRVSLP